MDFIPTIIGFWFICIVMSVVVEILFFLFEFDFYYKFGPVFFSKEISGPEPIINNSFFVKITIVNKESITIVKGLALKVFYRGTIENRGGKRVVLFRRSYSEISLFVLLNCVFMLFVWLAPQKLNLTLYWLLFLLVIIGFRKIARHVLNKAIM